MSTPVHLPVASWHEAVFFRKSRRSFIPGRPVGEDQLERLEILGREFRPFPGARFEIVRRAPDDFLRGLLGRYGAPAFAVMIGKASDPGAPVRVGYTGEALILEATAIGLGTCWVGGMFRDEEARKSVSLAAGERIFALTPLGVGARDFSLKEKLYIRGAGSRKRKAKEDLIEGTSPRPWQDAAVAAARLAPSARNRQPWRFILGPDSITVVRGDGPDGDRCPKSLDCGIAMLHLELGARAAEASGEWTFLSPPAVARYVLRS
jgi:nitroreductase